MCTIHPFLLFLLFAKSIAFSVDTSNIWDAHRTHFGKEYRGKEIQAKLGSFSETVFRIVKHNIEADLHQHTFWTGLNEWSELSTEERRKLHRCIIPDNETESQEVPLFNRTGISDVPKNFDNRKLGLVTSIKNQKGCGGCWAFAAAAAMEGQWAKYQCELMEISVQNALDCAKPNGCSGGMPFSAYFWSMEHGLNLEKDYPLICEDQDCKFKKDKVAYMSRGVFNVAYRDEVALRDAVYHVGPITILFYSSRSDFLEYKQGIYEPKGECGTSFDHAVVMVGYGYDDKSRKSYWIMKNSWGTSFGEKGYARIIRGANICLITKKPSFPVV